MSKIELDIFSPLHQLSDALFDDKGLKVFLKRDDLIHPIISGNKWRKLKYPLQTAQSQGKTRLVTFGGAFSNHLMATAAAAARFGFQSTGIVRGEEINNDTLWLCRLHGMELIFVDRDSYRDKPALFNKFYGDDPSAFYINEGGASADATLGCAELLDELPQTFNHIFCACGTGTTAAGLINGINERKLATQFHAVPVLKGDFMRTEINRYLTDDYAYNIHPDYHFGGYAKTCPELINFIKKFIAETGILIEPVYTGKMLYALYQLAATNYFAPGSSLMAVHTGGIWGLLGMKEKF